MSSRKIILTGLGAFAAAFSLIWAYSMYELTHLSLF